MKKVLLLSLLVSFTLSIQAQGLKGLLGKAKGALASTGLSQDEAGGGIKEALNIGLKEAVGFLSKKDGYYASPYKILLPKEAQSVVNKLSRVPGFKNAEEKVIKNLNEAAEDAAKSATPIFVSAIKEMTFKDALNILMGDKNSATVYLEKATYDKLYAEFKPIIIASLDKVKARDYWRSAVKAHNKVPFVKKANPELDDYVANKALEGMFKLVEKKEGDIRGDKSLRTSPLLKKVFAKQDK